MPELHSDIAAQFINMFYMEVGHTLFDAETIINPGKVNKCIATLWTRELAT